MRRGHQLPAASQNVTLHHCYSLATPVFPCERLAQKPADWATSRDNLPESGRERTFEWAPSTADRYQEFCPFVHMVFPDLRPCGSVRG
jgi:hypothetical protein